MQITPTLFFDMMIDPSFGNPLNAKIGAFPGSLSIHQTSGLLQCWQCSTSTVVPVIHITHSLSFGVSSLL